MSKNTKQVGKPKKETPIPTEETIPVEETSIQALTREQAITLLLQEKEVTKHQGDAIQKMQEQMQEQNKHFNETMDDVREKVSENIGRLENKIMGAALVAEGLTTILNADFKKSKEGGN